MSRWPVSRAQKEGEGTCRLTAHRAMDISRLARRGCAIAGTRCRVHVEEENKLSVFSSTGESAGRTVVKFCPLAGRWFGRVSRSPATDCPRNTERRGRKPGVARRFRGLARGQRKWRMASWWTSLSARAALTFYGMLIQLPDGQSRRLSDGLRAVVCRKKFCRNLPRLSLSRVSPARSEQSVGRRSLTNVSSKLPG